MGKLSSEVISSITDEYDEDVEMVRAEGSRWCESTCCPHERLIMEISEYIKVCKQRDKVAADIEKRNAEMWNSVKAQILGWGIIAIVGYIGALLISHFEVRVPTRDLK